VSIRFHLDEHISAHIAAGLRRRNIDVTTTVDAGLIGAPDETHLEFAALSGRVLVTQDDDFLRLHAQGVAHAGIAYCRQQSNSIGEMLRRIILIYDLLSREEVAGRVEFL
jgi:predicted nuclease of predicted toxin-antitoxin system